MLLGTVIVDVLPVAAFELATALKADPKMRSRQNRDFIRTPWFGHVGSYRDMQEVMLLSAAFDMLG